MSIHTGLKPYKCQFCDERFRTSGNRRSHENAIHLGKSKASKEHKQAKVTDILQSVALEVLNNVNGVDVENLEGDQNMEDQSKDRDADTFPPETINLIPSDNLLANLPDDQSSIDPVALFQQLQMSGMWGDVKDNVHVVSVPSKEDQNNVDSRRNKTDKNKGVECDICYKVYSSKDVLRKHKKNVHGLNKKFPCAKCEKRFNTQDELSKHVKLHSGYRPFSCLYCANSFTEKQSLRTHMKRIHRDVNIAKETSALLNMKFDLPSATIDDPLLNNLFAKKDNVVLLE
ncbi:hypothetical protein NQ317_007432 [Molorchus minor]|uniref:C2H2-type domain-containing protein n=1 Tax=Molorchus minor TaxID=1323400 RepID=A0ABQ9JGZ4_9CUCU|nr:hypothetical protein NQ317_007432 [Molorchus minor]